MIDIIKNFAKGTASTGYGSGDTSIVLTTGHGARFPQPSTDGSFNLVWWNSTDYRSHVDDPYVEIVRCTARSTDTLTVSRAQEGTTATVKNIAGKTYSLALAPTKKNIDDLLLPVIGSYTAGEDISAGNAVCVGDGLTYSSAIQQISTGTTDSIDDVGWIGQVFKTSSTAKYITAVTFSVLRNGVSYEVWLKNVSGGLPTIGFIVKNGDTVANTGGYEARTISFTQTAVSPNTLYAVVIRGASGTGIFESKVSSGYTDGYLVSSADDGDTWSMDTSRDLYFKIHEIDSTGGEIYKASAQNSDYFRYYRYIGFAENDATSGNTVRVRHEGVVSGQSSLTVGSTYYLSNTTGSISTTAGAGSKKVGLAISSTQLLLKQDA